MISQFARADADGDCAITVEDVKLVEEIVTEGGLVGTSPRKELAWDAENRLIKVEPVGNAIFVNDTKCEFKYDYQGRRFEKKVFARVSGAWAHSYTQRFVWGSSPAGNGWLMLMVVDGSVTLSPSAAERKYTWGRDLSGHGGGSSGSASCGDGLGPVGCLTGAGGIGGLLSVYDNALAGTGATAFQFAFMYDANGNVGQVNDYTQTTAAAAMVAKYGYDAYGNVNSKSGTYADTNTFRFSTKFWDTETNLGYWGYRYYDAGLGRWISRDPIGEIGGPLLYGYCGQRPTLAFDALGQRAQEFSPPYPPSGCGLGEYERRKRDWDIPRGPIEVYRPPVRPPPPPLPPISWCDLLFGAPPAGMHWVHVNAGSPPLGPGMPSGFPPACIAVPNSPMLPPNFPGGAINWKNTLEERASQTDRDSMSVHCTEACAAGGARGGIKPANSDPIICHMQCRDCAEKANTRKDLVNCLLKAMAYPQLP